MATVSCSNNVHSEVEFTVSGLQHNACDYDKFVWRVYQPTGTGNETTQVIQYTYDRNSELGEVQNFTFTFDNPNYLGNNWFSPNCVYVVLLDCYWNGECYTLPSTQFSTASVNPPAVSSITPPIYPYIKTQGGRNNCVAQSLSTAMEIFQYIATGKNEQYSISYIFGMDEREEENMYFDEAVSLTVNNGSPRWELVTLSYPDNSTKAASVIRFQKAKDAAKQNAANQKFSGYLNVDFYDTDSVAQFIQDYGFFMFNFRIPNNFNSVGSDGIVPQPDTYSNANHSIALIGLTTKGGKKYWIAQNSWGESWGDGGVCYIPYDWGSGVLPPETDDLTSPRTWTLECYAIWNDRTFKTNTHVPRITSVSQVKNQKAFTMTWTGDASNDLYCVLLRTAGNSAWFRREFVSDTTITLNASVGDKELAVIGLTATDRVCSVSSNIATVTIRDPAQRPSDFAWTNVKVPRGKFNLTAVEWSELCDSVVAFLTYTKNLNTQIGENEYSLPSETTYYEIVTWCKENAVQGTEVTAQMFNYICCVIGRINGVGTGIETKYPGSVIYASLLNTMVQKLNLIE